MSVLRKSAGLLLAGGLFVFAGCDFVHNPTTPDGDDFVAALTAAQTVPSVPDQGGSGYATFRFVDGGSALAYEIAFSGLDIGAIKGDPQTPDESDDITKIHIHIAPVGVAGPHVLNIYGAPAEDDDDMTFDAEAGVIRGVWDDGDANTDLPDHAQSRPLSDVVDALCSGGTYLNVHTAAFDDGIVRGQILPVDPEVCAAVTH